MTKKNESHECEKPFEFPMWDCTEGKWKSPADVSFGIKPETESGDENA